jgi:WD40 repeat protein
MGSRTATGFRRGRVPGYWAACLAVAMLLTTFASAAWARTGKNELWVATYNGPRSGEDVPVGMAASRDGSTVFVTGTSRAGGDNSGNFATVAYDAATGKEAWKSIFSPPERFEDDARAIAASPTEDLVFVTGSSEVSLDDSDDFATIAYDSVTGKPAWTQRYDGLAHGQDLPTYIGVSPDGSRVFVTGSTTTGPSQDDFATIAYDANTGHQLWLRTFDDADHLLDGGERLAVAPDGSSVFVTGHIDGSTVVQTATVAYDAATGRKLWVQRYAGLQYASPAAIAASPDGSSVFLLANTSGGGQNFTFATVKYAAATGDILWQRRYHSAGNDDIPTSLAVSPDGARVFSAGSSFRASTGGIDYTTISYDAATGARGWVRHYNGPGDAYDAITSVDVSPGGTRLYVGGLSYGSTSDGDYGTIAYDTATGATEWTRRFNGAANSEDRAVSVVADPDGSKVFVTGGSFSSGGAGRDYATVAYAS